MTMTVISEVAAQFWHDRMGRFLGDHPWYKSLSSSYPTKNFKTTDKYPDGRFIGARLGTSGVSSIMLDAKSGVLIDRIALEKIDSILEEDNPGFQYGEATKGVDNADKTQINWALDPARLFPMLLIRPSKADVMSKLILSHTCHRVTVCSASASFTFEIGPVRQARDYIAERGLEGKWKKAASLRETISLGEHLGTKNENALLKSHGEMLELFPLDVWLPEVDSGNYRALAESLIVKPVIDISKLPYANTLMKCKKKGEKA